MVERFLITTALEETWCDNEPVLFLGEWCRRYSRQSVWSKMDSEVLPYHWDDRAKLYLDYQYLQKLHERLLVELTEKLNQIHHVNYGVRYWRILLGPWLGQFTQMLFDRWCSIQQAITKFEISKSIVLKGKEDTLIPNDMTHFLRLCVGDEWNHHLYSYILRQFTKVSCADHNRTERILNTAAQVSWKRRTRGVLSASYVRAASLLTRNQDAFFMATYLPMRDEIRLHQRFGQVPQRWRSSPAVQVAVDERHRQWTVKGENFSEFENCTRSIISQQIPTIYLEGYKQLAEQARNMPWPKKPKLIWTSNAFISDDIFKIWAAEKIENGSPLVIGQHGGVYGVGRWSFTEDHEIAISDHYLSWGWTDTFRAKVKPVAQFKSKRPLAIQHSRQPGALLVTTTTSRQSYEMCSLMVSRQWLDYFNDQCVFVGNLTSPIRDALTVRLFAHDWGWDQLLRWRDRFPGVRLDNGISDINDLIRKSRLYISTYNGTTFLESFTMNIPTIIYWNPICFELRDSAIPYFEDLKRVGIFHESPESAARHVNAIWDDIETWWNGKELQEVLERFKRRYCYLPENLLDRVEKTLKDVMVISNQTAAESRTMRTVD